MTRIWFLSLLLVAGFLTSPALAQNGGGIIVLPPPITLPPPGSCAKLDGDDATVETGSAFDVAFRVGASDTLGMVSAFIQCDPTAVTLNDWTEGAAIQDYIDDHGPFPCDVSIMPDGMFFSMWFPVPFDPQLYGQEVAVLHYTAGTAAVQTTLTVLDTCTNDPVAEVQISIVDDLEPPIVRGDVDANGSCNLADAVKILQHVFAGGLLECQDGADMDDSGNLTLADPVLLLQGLFGDGPGLEEQCEQDPTMDGLGCDQSGCP